MKNIEEQLSEYSLDNLLRVRYSFDSNEMFENEYDLWFMYDTRDFKVHRKIYSGFDEDVYDYLKNMLTENNSFTILKELKKKGVI